MVDLNLYVAFSQHNKMRKLKKSNYYKDISSRLLYYFQLPEESQNELEAKKTHSYQTQPGMQ